MVTRAMGAGAPRVFYVDSVAGDDVNAGDSPEAAWASLGRVSNADLKPGDTVRFKRGGVWRGTLTPRSGAMGAPITYAAYGEGEKPLLLDQRDLRYCFREGICEIQCLLPTDLVPHEVKHLGCHVGDL